MEDFVPVDVKGEVGRGAFGVVYMVEHAQSKEQFAVKVVELRRDSKWKAEGDKKEAELLHKLDHVNIVKYVTAYELKSALLIVTEFCAGGDLHSYLYKTSDDKLPEDLVLAWTLQISRAVQYLHSRNVLHRDLKPANVYLMSDGDVRVGDLGLARVLANANMNTRSVVGTPAYSSPEILRGYAYNRKTDIWSLGCVVLEMAERKKSSYTTTLLYLFSFLQQGKMPFMLTSSLELKRLVYSMLDNNPKKRPDAADILSHPLLKNFRERPADVIRRCKARPVMTAERKFHQSFFSLSSDDVRISSSALHDYRQRCSQDSPDAASLDMTDWELVQPGLGEPGLEAILRALRVALGHPAEAEGERTPADEESPDPATIREYYLKQFRKVKSDYKLLLSEATVDTAMAAIASAEDHNAAWAKLAAVLGEGLTDHGHNLMLLYLAEVGCGEHLTYQPPAPSSWRCRLL